MNLMFLDAILSHLCPHHYLQEPRLAYASAHHPSALLLLALLSTPPAMPAQHQYGKASDASRGRVSRDFSLSQAERG